MMSATIWNHIVEALGWSLLHFVWQGALIASATALGLAFLRNARPQWRYALCCLALFLCLLWPACSVLLQWLEPQTVSLAAALQIIAASPLSVDLIWVERSHLAAQLDAALPLLVSVWSVGVAIMLSRLGLGLVWVRRLGAHAGGQHVVLTRSWQQQTTQLARRLGITRSVRLQLEQRVLSPVTIGIFKPVIFMPASLLTGMAPDMIVALLAHELAHIKRWDYLANLLQNLLLSLLFYHPAVWWISRRIDAERELIADDLATTLLGQARPLASALQQLDQWRAGQLALAAQGGDLLSRIKRLIRPDAQAWHWKMASPALGLAFALCFLLQARVDAGQTQATVPAVVAHNALQDVPQQIRVDTHSAHVLVMDEQSGKELMAKNADTVVAMASLSKLLTAMAVLDAGQDKNEVITLVKQDYPGFQNSDVKLQTGMRFTRAQLLELMLVPSSNVAARALARTYPGGQANLVATVQKKIAGLGLRVTSFAEPTGISGDNRSSARELARIARLAATYPDIRRLSNTAEGHVEFAGKSQTFHNTNGLVGQAEWDISLSKTGTSREAGRCLLMRIRQAGKDLIVVLLNAKNLEYRNDDAQQIRAALLSTVQTKPRNTTPPYDFPT